MVTKVFYVVWFLIPLAFFTVALWAKLEQIAKSPRRQNPGDFFRQGVFLLLCAILSVLIDHFLLWRLDGTPLADWLPLYVFQLLLLPAVWLVCACLFGGSQQIGIKDPAKNKPRAR